MDTDGIASYSAGLPAGGRLTAGYKSSARRQTQFCLAALSASVLFAFAQTAHANPTGANVVNGQASFATTGNTLTVTNTPGTIINWQGFSIGSNEITRFAQQSASSAVLNRVISNDPSNILGTLQSNGRVFLINPNGILFGAGAVVDVAGLVASTLNLSDADFLAGNSHYTQIPGAANISNAGSITARGDGQSGGQIYLIAPNVENTGVMTAPNGEILLAAGYSVDLVSTDEPNLRVNITAPAGDATNVGQLIASSGSLGLFGTVVSNSGIVSADSAVMQGGKIVFKARQLVQAGGTVSATGTTGGNIEVLGNEVQVTAGASLDASGATGGGTVLVGGDAHGANPNVMNAQTAYVDAAATIKADAVQNGNGGKVVVWADIATQFGGNISARGGAVSGNGGWVEVSGKQWLGYAGLVDTTAPYGLTGTLLLDPTDITISGAASTGTMAFNGVTFTYADVTATPSNLNVTTLQTQLASSNVTISSASPLAGTGNITVQESIAWNSANSLTLNAAGSGAITVNAVNLSNGGTLTIANAGTGGLSMLTAGGAITIGGALGGSVTLAGGSFTANAGGAASAININSAINTGAGAINLTAGGTVSEGAGGTLTTSGLLTTKSAGGTTLNNANAVGSFNAINTTSGNIALTNNAVLNVTGINNTAAAGSVTVSNGTALGITGTIAAAGGGAINLTATGAAITEAGAGLIGTTGLLTTNSYSGTTLNGANSVGSLNATNIMISDFSFSNSTPAAYFYINGISNVGGNITVNNAGSVMGITGTISGSAAINLSNTGASGGIQESGGGKILTTGILTTNNGSASGTNLNNGGANMIGTFKATDAGLVFLQNGTALNLAGISAGGGVLISTNSGGITVSGPVNAGSSSVFLQGFGITNNSTITGGAGVTLTAGYSGFAPVGTLTNAGVITNGGGASTGAINLNADIMVLAGGTVTAGAGAVNINNVTLTDAIDLGSTTDVANLTLELSSGELATISTTGLVSIGNASNSGAITVSAPLTLTYDTALANGAGGIAINGAITATGKNLTLDTAGAATQTAAITAAGLELLGTGSYTLNNAANSIATVAGNAGSISLTDSSALSVGTVNTAGLTSTGAVLLTSSGDISQTASISTTATGNAIVLDAAGNFINKAGAAALSAPNGRWLVYSTDPALDTFGGLMSGNLALWGKTSINYAPGSVVETGNRYLFGLVPALSVSADLVKIYGTDLTLAPPPATISGLIDAAAYGNVFTQDAVTGTASLASTGFAASAAISVNPYPVIVAAGSLLAPAGYGVTTYITGSLYVLAPTVVDEIVEISNQRPRKTADVLALETPPADGGNTQPIPMCN